MDVRMGRDGTREDKVNEKAVGAGRELRSRLHVIVL